MTEDLSYMRNQISLARTEIKKLRQQLSSLKHEHSKEVDSIKTALRQWKCTSCLEKDITAGVLKSTIGEGHSQIDDNNSTSPVNHKDDIVPFRPIGSIETSFQNKRAVPRQTSVLSSCRGVVRIDNSVLTNPDHALSGLEEFSHMWIIFHFHSTGASAGGAAKVSPPRLHGARVGVFATRAPRRPCPIGLSLVQIVSIEDNKIYFSGVDMVNGTPVLDIKPYIPQYDNPIVAFGNHSSNSLESIPRPPTEGLSNSQGPVDTYSTLDSRNMHSKSSNQRRSAGVGVNGASSSQKNEGSEVTSLAVPTLDIPDGSRDNLSSIGASPVSEIRDSPSSEEMLGMDPEQNNAVPVSHIQRDPMPVPGMERGNPDGQERFTPPQNLHINNSTFDADVRVAQWVSNPPASRMEVRFTDDAIERLVQLSGERASAIRINLESLLAEDPRSHYVRSRYPDHEYSCVIEHLAITCMFNNATSVCTVTAITGAQDIQGELA